MEYSDGSFSTAAHHGAPTTMRPFYGLGDPAHVVLTQPCMVDRSGYAPLAVGTAHPTISGLYLAEENSDSDALAGLMIFNRIYINKPATRDDFESYNFNYWPIMGSGAGYVWFVARMGGSRTVTSRVRREYFRVGSGLDYNSAADIPIIPKLTPYYMLPGGVGQPEAWWIGVFPDADGGPSSVPDAATFLAMGEFVGEDSEIDHYRGDVWVRSTRYIPVGEMP